MRTTRQLFTSDGDISRQQAYEMLDASPKGTVFFRIVISPDPKIEDTNKDLQLGQLTEITMSELQERLRQEIPYVYVTHEDHAPNRHVHVIVAVAGRLNVKDFQALRERATAAALLQRQQLDLARQSKARYQTVSGKEREQEEGLEWSW